MIEDKRKAMVMGAFSGDALALGAHWVYNTRVIDKKFGTLDRYADPLTSYHGDKKAGDFTHYGDQMMVLLESVAAAGGFEGEHFAQHWHLLFQNYGGYFDKATKTTLHQMDDQKEMLNSGSTSDDLAGASRIAPLVYAYHADQDRLDQSVRRQTAITHNNGQVIECAAFFAQVATTVLRGDSPADAIEAVLAADAWSESVTDVVRSGVDSRNRDTRDTISAFGQMCSTEAALPGTVHLICTYENDFKRGLVENVMAGGDSAARGLLLGMVLGAHCGMDAIPARWLSELKERRRIEQLLDALDAG
jgi:ADP-ribosylglycohydrolase